MKRVRELLDLDMELESSKPNSNDTMYAVFAVFGKWEAGRPTRNRLSLSAPVVDLLIPLRIKKSSSSFFTWFVLNFVHSLQPQLFVVIYIDIDINFWKV